MKTPCKYPGCGSLLDRSGYCNKHAGNAPNHRKRYDKGRRANTPALAAAANFRSSYLWKKTQNLKIRSNPFCEDPYKQHERRGTTETAKQVHHIVGLAECAKDERAYKLSNLMSVCFGCHARLEREAKANAPVRA